MSSSNAFGSSPVKFGTGSSAIAKPSEASRFFIFSFCLDRCQSFFCKNYSNDSLNQHRDELQIVTYGIFVGPEGFQILGIDIHPTIPLNLLLNTLQSFNLCSRVVRHSLHGLQLFALLLQHEQLGMFTVLHRRQLLLGLVQRILKWFTGRVGILTVSNEREVLKLRKISMIVESSTEEDAYS